MTTYGYARVSTDGQSLASQDAQLHAAGCAKVYAEKISGARSDRAELAKVLKRLGSGDVLMVTRLDRLARSTRDLLNILDTIAKAGAGFKFIARCMGGHDDTAWPAHVDGAGRPSRVRARADPCPYRRRPGTSESPWREIRPPGGIDCAPAAGGHRAAR